MRYSTLREEKKLWKQGYKVVACIDEVGRGPLAGPVVACAVVINPKHEIRNPKQILNFKSKYIKRVWNFDIRISNLKLRDSKQLSAKQRAYFYKILTAHPAIKWGIGKVYPTMIDRINIFQATKLAMKRAVRNLEKKRRKHYSIDFLILDGNMRLAMPLAQKSIVKGDEKVFSCAVASIIAKVKRDRAMARYHRKYPLYGFHQHKGYGTKLHFEMLRFHGPCPLHRKSFL